MYVLETDPYWGCIKHMHSSKGHRNLCVRDRPI